MVDGIGSRPVTEAKVARITATTAVAAATADAGKAAAVDTATLSGVASSLSASPPVDTDRVAQIKKAIASGDFPILPATIADRLMALKLQWNGHEQA